MNDRRPSVPPGLHFVSTPIGNARDITLRALDVLAGADAIAAEDTRTARKLMEIHGIALGDRRLIAYHDHSGEGGLRRLLAELGEGRSLAYVSEAGTPLVADPGFELGRAAAEAGVPVLAAPGASAVLAALTVAGLPSDRFAFLGFLPSGSTQRRTALAEVADLPMTLVFYESPKRIQDCLTDMCEILGQGREAVLCRELTKRFEDVRRGTLGSLAAGAVEDPPRGEIVILVGRSVAAAATTSEVEAALREAMRSHRMKDAATVVAGALGLPRRQVYQVALGLKEDEA